MIDWIGV